MREMIQMVVVLTVLSFVSGGLLAYVKDGTKDKIEFQQLTFWKGPAIKEILKGAGNDPITDRFKLKDGDAERSFFVGVFDGKPDTVAFESSGKGYGGELYLVRSFRGGVDLQGIELLLEVQPRRIRSPLGLIQVLRI